MHADIAVAERAEKRVRQGMQQDITVRMRDDATRVSDLHAAQHHEGPLAEGVHVIAKAGAGLGLRLQMLGRAGEIGGQAQFRVFCLTLEDMDVEPCPFGKPAVIGALPDIEAMLDGTAGTRIATTVSGVEFASS